MHAHNNISLCNRRINQWISNSLARKLVLLVVVKLVKVRVGSGSILLGAWVNFEAIKIIN